MAVETSTAQPVDTNFLDSLANGTFDGFSSDNNEQNNGAQPQQAASNPSTEGNQDNADQQNQPDQTNTQTQQNQAQENQNNGVKKPETPAEPVFDDAAIVKMTGGQIKTVQEFSDLVATRQRYADLESKYNAVENEVNNLRAKANVDPFANDFVKKLNGLFTNGATPTQIQAFTDLSNAGDLDQMQPLDVRKLRLQLEEGLTSREADIYLNRNYKLDPDKYDEEEVEASKVQLRLDRNKDLAFLKEQQAKLSAVEKPEDKDAERAALQAKQYAEKLGPIAKNISQTFTQVKGVSLNGKTGDDALLADFNISDESKQMLEQAITNFATANNIALNEEGMKAINGFAESFLAVNNWRNWLIEAAVQTEKRIREEFHNPKPIDRGGDNPVGGTTSKDDQASYVAENY